MVVTIIGTGLIGGSMSLVLQQKGFASRVLGVELNPDHAAKALSLGLVHEILSVEKAVQQSDLIILSTPINVAEEILPGILDLIDKQVIMDVGSTKKSICEAVAHHPNRARFVATHPMWGTENSGPEAAVDQAFAKKATIICGKEETAEDALALVEKLYRLLDMHLLYMQAKSFCKIRYQ